MDFAQYIKFAQAYQKLSIVQKRAVSRLAKLGAENIKEYEKRVAQRALDIMLSNYEVEMQQDEWTDELHCLFGAHTQLDEVM